MYDDRFGHFTNAKLAKEFEKFMKEVYNPAIDAVYSEAVDRGWWDVPFGDIRKRLGEDHEAVKRFSAASDLRSDYEIECYLRLGSVSSSMYITYLDKSPRYKRLKVKES
jgi:hypothetical protein